MPSKESMQHLSKQIELMVKHQHEWQELLNASPNNSMFAAQVIALERDINLAIHIKMLQQEVTGLAQSLR